MIVRVDVSPSERAVDGRGHSLLRQARELGIDGLTGLEVRDVYFLEGAQLTADEVEAVVGALLVDPVVQQARWGRLDAPGGWAPEVAAADAVVEVTYLPGVTDTVAESLLEAAHGLGALGLSRAASARRYLLHGEGARAAAPRIASGVLANEVIEKASCGAPVEPPFVEAGEPQRRVEIIGVRAADDAGLLTLSQSRRLALDLHEMRAVQRHFAAQGRDPTDVELEMLAQTWSEHCVHKTFRAHIRYSEPGKPVEEINGLLSTYIRAATEAAAKPWIRSAFVDNAGIVAFVPGWDLAFKVETHNHPSALEPFGGANTGVGGVIRDIIGVSARPIACTDVLCFGPPDLPASEVPEGVLPPRRVASGVIAGVGDYGNKMGIPTVSGAVTYDPDYVANPLVYCGCVGILPTGSHRSTPELGDTIFVIGGRTGRDGLRGATFSSMEMGVETSAIASVSVQIGHPIHEKQALEVVLVARDEGLYTAITDCGAGGLSSAVGEMGARLGARVQLERVPLKYPGLEPWEIWLSEAQERMVLAVPAANLQRMHAICAAHGVEAIELGVFSGDGRLHIAHGDLVVADLDVGFLHDGIPQRHLEARWSPPEAQPYAHLPDGDLASSLLTLLARPEIRSKEEILRTYDHEVQGGTLVKPLVGVDERGPSDAAVLLPLDVALALPLGAPSPGVALSVGLGPRYGRLDPYNMAWAAVDEAMRNAVAVGADPDQVSLLDNFCWGNPLIPDRLGGLVRCNKGCYDAAVAFGAPFISGKDSLNNEFTTRTGERRAIPGTLLISAMAIVPDVDKTVTSDLKAAGNRLYLSGITGDELGGSAYLDSHCLLGADAPARREGLLALYRQVHAAIAAGLVSSCHDCSEGGLAVAAAEMALAGGVGLRLDLGAVRSEAGVCRDDTLAFSESLGRLLFEVTPEHADAFEAALRGQPIAQVGETLASRVLVLEHLHNAGSTTLGLDEIEAAWRGHLRG